MQGHHTHHQPEADGKAHQHPDEPVHENDHGHGHQHDKKAHGHSHGPMNYDRVFAIGIALNVSYALIEAVAGFWLNSLSLVADAGHNLSDVAGHA